MKNQYVKDKQKKRNIEDRDTTMKEKQDER